MLNVIDCSVLNLHVRMVGVSKWRSKSDTDVIQPVNAKCLREADERDKLLRPVILLIISTHKSKFFRPHI